MPRPELPKQLRNNFHLMRHGHSKPNEQELIVSTLPLGLLPQHGLTDRGRQEVHAAGQKAPLNGDCIIYSSDFSRAVETAEGIGKVLGAATIQQTPLLRERNFGSLDGTHSDNYARIWRSDAADSHHTDHNVESVISVARRMAWVVATLDAAYRETDILLVSHGDPLSILQATAHGDRIGKHTSYHLANAEIVPLPFTPQ